MMTSMAGSVPPLATDAALPLPPLALPPRQLKKIQISCTKWLTRSLLTLAAAAHVRQTATSLATGAATATGFDDVDDVGGLLHHVYPGWPEASGFVALNGGILAGCSPYDVRNTLLTHGLLQPPLPSATETVLAYGSTLPFALCSRRLAIGEREKNDVTAGIAVSAAATAQEAGTDTANLSVLYVPVSELRRYAASTSASSAGETHSACELDPVAARRRTEQGDPAADDASGSERCGGWPAAAGSSSSASSSSLVGVVVLQLPPTASLWKGGSATAPSSANKGCGFLYLLPCDAAVVVTMVGHVFQKPVVGIAGLLQQAAAVHGTEHDEQKAGPTDSETSLSQQPEQRTCVSKAAPGIPGLCLVEDFLSRDEEATIWKELHDDRRQLQVEYLSRRRVAHFNRRFLYGVNALTGEGVEVNARPSFYDWMRGRLQNDDPTQSVRIIGDFPFQPGDYPCDQLTVNYYDYSEMGTCGIATHVDAHNAFDDAILIVSLGSYTVMDFARWDTPAETAAPIGVYLPPRSLAIMSGDSRYGWTHCIAEKRTDTISELLPTLTRGDRMSLTWRRGRTRRHVKAECPFPALCDGE